MDNSINFVDRIIRNARSGKIYTNELLESIAFLRTWSFNPTGQISEDHSFESSLEKLEYPDVSTNIR